MADRLDIVAAFADGETISAVDLSLALAHEDARAYRIDILALRGLVSGAKPQVSNAPGASAHARLRMTPLRAFAAAALVILCVATGFMVGRRTTGWATGPAGGGTDTADSAGSAITAGGTTSANTQQTNQTSAVAPAPTHVIRIENGVTWNERTGGN